MSDETAEREIDGVPGWDGTERVDGAKVSTMQRSGLIVVQAPPGRTFRPHGFVADQRAMLLACPCCNLPFRSTRAAQLVANILAPLVAQ